MADQTYTVSITGSDDIFKNLDTSINELAQSLSLLTKGQKGQENSLKSLSSRIRESDKWNVKMSKTLKDNLWPSLSKGTKGVTGLGMSLVKMVPYVGQAIAVAEGLTQAITSVYKVFTSQNKLIEQTGDVFGSLDLTYGSVQSSVTRLRQEIKGMAVATMGGTTTIKDHLEALKGYQTAGLVVSDLKQRFNDLSVATSQAITYGTLFSMKTDEMAQLMGGFTRELNLGAESSEAAFSTMFKSAVDARYGTRNFLNMVNQTVPTLGYYGGSVQEVGRMLQFMGRQGTVSMQQASGVVKMLTVGIKEMGLEQQTVLSALVSQDTMLRLGKNRLEELTAAQAEADKGSAEWFNLQAQIERMQIDLASAGRGERIAMGRMMEQMGPGSAIEVMFEAFGKVPGLQLKSLGDLNKISARQEMALLGIMKDFGLTQKELRTLQKIGTGEIKSKSGQVPETIQELAEAIRTGDIESLEEIEKSPEQMAEEYRKITQDMVAVTLDNIFQTLIEDFWPQIQWISEVLVNFAVGVLKYFKSDAAKRIEYQKNLIKQGMSAQEASNLSLDLLEGIFEGGNVVSLMLGEQSKTATQNLVSSEGWMQSLKKGESLNERQTKLTVGNLKDIQNELIAIDAATKAGRPPPGMKALGATLQQELTQLSKTMSETQARGGVVPAAVETAFIETTARAEKMGLVQNIHLEIKDSISPEERQSKLIERAQQQTKRMAEGR